MLEFKYLEMVDPTDNHNKYYKMVPDSSGKTFSAEYGRVGARAQKKQYPITRFYQIYNEKIEKGYQDMTHLHKNASIIQVDSKYAPCEDSVQWLMDTLMMYAKKTIEKNYTIKIEEVTSDMIAKAKEVLETLSEDMDLFLFNRQLQKLFTILPRKMESVAAYMATTKEDYAKILEREYDLLDVMSSQVATVVKKAKKHTSEETITDALGLDIRICTDAENKKICEKLSAESNGAFKRAWRVRNKKTDKAFDKWVEENHISKRDIHFFYHGSKNMNYYGITTEGLLLNPNAPITGKMFGHGIYFASRAKKSIGYTDIQGSFWAKGRSQSAFLMVFKVAYKSPLDVYSHKSEYTSYRYANLKKKGCDALFAHAGTMLRNDEIVIYQQEQCTLQYIIELAA